MVSTLSLRFSALLGSSRPWTVRASVTTALLCLSWSALSGPARAQSASPPANDNFALSQQLTGANPTANGTTVGATTEPTEPNSSNAVGTVWYNWTAPANATVTIAIQPNFNQASLTVYNGSSLAALQRVTISGNSPPSVTFQTIAGTVFQIQVGVGQYVPPGTFSLAISTKAPTVTSPVVVGATAQANDNFANQVSLNGPSGAGFPSISGIGYNVDATREAGEGTDPSQLSNSLWWSWTAPGDATVTMDTSGSSPNRSSIAVFSGSGSVAQLVPIALGYGGNPSSVTFQAAKNSVYRISTGTPPFYGASAYGSLIVNVNTAATKVTNPTIVGSEAAGNDNFANRITLPTTPVSGLGYSLAATRESLEPTDPNNFQRTLWWSWTAPSDGMATFDTTGSDGNYSVAVFTGTGLGALTLQGSAARANPATLTIPVSANTTYQITVGNSSFDPSNGGLIVLNVGIAQGKPVVTLTKPLTSTNSKGVTKAVVNGGLFAFKGTVTGGQGGVKKVTVNVAGFGVVKAKLAADGSWKAPFANVPAGVYTAVVSATDNAGTKSDKINVRLIVR